MKKTSAGWAHQVSVLRVCIILKYQRPIILGRILVIPIYASVYARITLRGRQGKYKLIKTLRHSELKYTAKSGTLYSIFKVSPY